MTSEDPPGISGQTMYSDNRLGEWLKPTGVYVPPGIDIDKGVVNVLIWLHGWYVPSIQRLFQNDRAKVREQVLSSGKKIVLAAPYLGNGHKGGADFPKNIADLKGKWGELFLNQVLSTLALGRDPNTYKPAWKRRSVGEPPPDPGKPALRLGKLVIACHSGGGTGMLNLVNALGRYKGNLAECWGFDCLYGSDDANFWYKWASGNDGRPLYVSYGVSTVPQSVKLDLLAQGVASPDGSVRDPEGQNLMRVNVKLGIPAAKSVDALMDLDTLLDSGAPKSQQARALGKKFVEQAANNLARNAGWPSDLMEMHYRIARDGLLERLKGSGFL